VLVLLEEEWIMWQGKRVGFDVLCSKR